MHRGYNLRKRHVSVPITSSKPVHQSQTPQNCQSLMPLVEVLSISGENINMKQNKINKMPKKMINGDSSTGEPGSGQDTSSDEQDHSKEQQIQEVPVIKMKDFSAVDMEEKLNLLMVAINKINTSFHHKFEELNIKTFSAQNALEPRITDCETMLANHADVFNDEKEGVLPRLCDAKDDIVDLKARIENLEEEKAKMQDEIFALKGYIQVQDNKMHQIESKVIDLTARSMKNNILINGIAGDPGNNKEECKEKALAFMRTHMKLEINDDEIIAAHRIGRNTTSKPRAMVVKCAHDLHTTIFGYSKNLKGLKNEHGDYYRVSSQLLEPLNTQNRERREKIAATHKLNETLDSKDKIKIEVKGNMLLLNGKPQKKYVTPPTIREMMAIPPEVQVKMDKIILHESEMVKEKDSSFVGYAAQASSATDVRLAYKKVRQIAPDADHIMMAYAIKQHSGYHDDGEHMAGKRISSILADRVTTNTVIFVSRIYGGVHLGPKRFLLIEKVAREALNKLQAAF